MTSGSQTETSNPSSVSRSLSIIQATLFGLLAHLVDLLGQFLGAVELADLFEGAGLLFEHVGVAEAEADCVVERVDSFVGQPSFEQEEAAVVPALSEPRVEFDGALGVVERRSARPDFHSAYARFVSAVAAWSVSSSS